MSGRYVSRVLDSDLSPLALKLTAVAMASFADDVDGRNVRPSMDYVAWLTGLQVRAVQVHVKTLRGLHVLNEVQPATRWRPAHYQMDLTKLPVRPPFRPASQQAPLPDAATESPGVHPGAPLVGVSFSPDPSPLGVHPGTPDPSVHRSVSTHTYGDAPAIAAALPLIVAPARDPDHAAHAWCGRVCVPKFLHKQFKQALGGQVTKRAARMRAFYTETLAAIPAVQPIGADPVKFWRAKFAARFEVRVPAATAPSPRVAIPNDLYALTEEQARQRRRGGA